MNSVAKSCLTLCDPLDYSPPGFSVQDFTGENTEVGCRLFLQGIFSTQRLNVSLELAGGFFTTEPPGKLVSVSALC